MSKKPGKDKSLAKKRRKERQLAKKQPVNKSEQVKDTPLPIAEMVEVVTEPPTDRPEQAMRLIIQPADVWFFRDGKPFLAGENHAAVSRFPPTPLTMQGVIRSKILLDSGADLAAYAKNPEAHPVSQEIGGKEAAYGQLKLRGPYLARKNGDEWQRYYPLPADVVKDKEKNEYHRLVLKKEGLNANWPTGQPYHLALSDTVTKAEPAFGWISKADLMGYLESGAVPQYQAVLRQKQVYQIENRFNFKVERATYRPERQYLTETGFIRPCPDIALEMELQNVTMWSEREGYLGIGGEARAGYYYVLPCKANTYQSQPLASFLVYFATPAWFRNGWLPENWHQWFTGGPVTLKAAAVNRAERIGGWDIVQGEKPMRAYVPAGSVYYFEGDGEVTYTGQPITDDPADGQIGFGQVFIGKWQK